MWNKISVIMESMEASWCIFGDFNEVRGSDERMNSQLNVKGAADFNKFIRRDELRDVPLGGKSSQE